MKKILQEIIANKKREVQQQKLLVPETALANKLKHTSLSLKNSLLSDNNTGIIAEFKRKSPSKGWLKKEAVVADIVTAYEKHGAAAVSILTDENYFGGSNDDVLTARKLIDIPILRKEFMVDAYQITEAKAIGADVILLIATALTKAEVKEFAARAKDLGLEVLLEVHDEAELEYDCDAVDMIGVNNRNLDTLEVSVQTSLDLIKKIPANKIAIAESGIANPETVLSLKRAGFKGFLIGETFMKHPHPAIAFAEFTHQLKAMA